MARASISASRRLSITTITLPNIPAEEKRQVINMVEAQKRRNRILCLHGPSQSAASFRAALKPTCDQMGKHFEFHFLEAPYIVADPGEVDNWTSAAVLASHIAALETDQSYRDEEGKNIKEADRTYDLVEKTKQRLNSTQEGKEVASKGAYEDLEGFVSRKTGRSLSRDWVSLVGGKIAGVQLALAQIGDYMRENGAFHGIIGYETGGAIALLIQTLLSHPYSSAKQFSSFFPRLPKGVNRMQRMGGWEEEPPPPDDPRLGEENLPRNYVPSQKPFEMIISLQPGNPSTTLSMQANDWIKIRRPLLSTISADAFSVHSVIISSGTDVDSRIGWERRCICKSEEDLLSTHWCRFLANWMTLAVESYLGDEEARKHLLQLDGVAVTAKL